MRRTAVTTSAAVTAVVALSVALIPLRSRMSLATVGLIMVIPVVAAVSAGGYVPGVVTVAAGFLAWDYVFIPPYYTLDVGAAQNWVALGVYVVVMLLVAQVVTRLQAARRDAHTRATEAQSLFELSQMLVEDRSLDDLLESIVAAVGSVFGAGAVALLLPADGRLEVVAATGEPLDLSGLTGPADRAGGSSGPLLAVPLATLSSGGGSPGRDGSGVRTVSLAAAGRPIGVLVVRGGLLRPFDPELLQTFANHAALAVERSQLRSEVLRARLIEELDEMRRALLGAVSHDLRTPLATMKVASSTLLAGEGSDDPDRHEMVELLDGEIDRLDRVVTGLVEMTRYQSGGAAPAGEPQAILDLVAEATAGMRASLGERAVDVLVPDDLPAVMVDRVLVVQVIVNLLDNAHRHAAPGSALTVSAAADGDQVVVSVADEGPGVAPDDAAALFDGLLRPGRGGRSGLGLWICRTFVEAHGGRIWLDPDYRRGARFCFSLPTEHVADRPAAEVRA